MKSTEKEKKHQQKNATVTQTIDSSLQGEKTTKRKTWKQVKFRNRKQR